MDGLKRPPTSGGGKRRGDAGRPGRALHARDEELLSRLAVEQAHITHHHPLSDAACVSVGTMIQRGLFGAPLRAAAEELAARHPEFRFEKYGGKSSGYVVDTLRTVFDAFFSHGQLRGLHRENGEPGGRRGYGGVHRRRDRRRPVRGRRDPAAVVAGARPESPEELSTLAEDLVRKSPLFEGTSPR